MKDFYIDIQQNICFGVGAVSQLPKLLSRQAISSVLIVTGPSHVKRGYIKTVTDALDNGMIRYAVFSDVEANPSIETVNKALAAFKQCSASALVAFGGGSPMDVAKAVSVLAVYKGEITEYEGLGKVPGKTLPIIAIPTTAGTGSEVTASAVVTDHERHFKFSIMSPEIIPYYSILDPQFLTSLPQKIAASTGVDAIVHALESYISLDATPFTEALAEKALYMLGANIRSYSADRSNIEAASEMLVGSNFAGIAFARTKLGDVHAMAHPLGGYFNIAHGVANAVLLPTVVDFNSEYVPETKYELIYRAISGDKTGVFNKPMLPVAIRALTSELGIPQSLSELNVDPSLIPNMAADSLKSGNAKVNPRLTTLEDFEELYRKSM